MYVYIYCTRKVGKKRTRYGEEGQREGWRKGGRHPTYLWLLSDNDVQIDVGVNEVSILIPPHSPLNSHETVLLKIRHKTIIFTHSIFCSPPRSQSMFVFTCKCTLFVVSLSIFSFIPMASSIQINVPNTIYHVATMF